MYAVIKSGGKQYRVEADQTVKLEKIEQDEGSVIQFDEILMIADGENLQVGTPLVNGKVTAKIVKHGRHDKIDVIKFKRRKHHMKRQGHRQYYTEVKITGIEAA